MVEEPLSRHQNWLPDSPSPSLVSHFHWCHQILQELVPSAEFIILTQLTPHTPSGAFLADDHMPSFRQDGVFFAPEGHLKTAEFHEEPTSCRALFYIHPFLFPLLHFS